MALRADGEWPVHEWPLERMGEWRMALSANSEMTFFGSTSLNKDRYNGLGRLCESETHFYIRVQPVDNHPYALLQ
jgi:hypothetical protein